MLSTKRKGKSGGPKNFQNSAVKTPRRASAPSTKVTTGSRTRRKRNNGNRMDCQTTHRAHLPRSPAMVSLVSVTGIEPGTLLVGPLVTGEDEQRAHPYALVRAVARPRGRPPFRPFLRAAAALAAEDRRPPTRPNSAIHSGPANTDDTSPGTLRSTSRASQCRPPPRPRTSTDRTSLGEARLSAGISFTGIVISAPLVSSMRSVLSLA